jgi:hypothetical protein
MRLKHKNTSLRMTQDRLERENGEKRRRQTTANLKMRFDPPRRESWIKVKGISITRIGDLTTNHASYSYTARKG